MENTIAKSRMIDLDIDLIIKWVFGTSAGILGAILLSLNFEYSKYGYLLFTISSLAWIYISMKRKDNALLSMQLFFTGINFIGIYQWMM